MIFASEPLQGTGVGNTLLLSLSRSLSVQRPRLSEAVAPLTEERATVRDLARQVLKLRHSLDSVRLGARLNETAGKSAAQAAAVTSNSPLGLSFQATSATLTSTEEVNTIPTSYSPFAPVFSGGSTATPIIGGIYDGSNGDDTLTFGIKKGGVVGSDNINLEVRDGTGKKIDNLTFNPGFVPGTEVALSNGLTFTLTAGTVDKNDSFQLDVFATVGSAVLVDNPFNGIGNDRPNLEPGLPVVAGSFFINGTQIDVVDTDSVNSVLAKITSSAAGVVASFDAATETVVLTQKTAGPGGQIVLGSDSTGFFDAVKLTGAVVVPGVDNELELPISQVSGLAGIGSGTFSINGVSLTVDTSVDTLNDIIDRINASGAGATANYDQATNKLDIVANSGGALDLDDGTSGFFTGVNITPGVYNGKASETKAQGTSRRLVHAEDFPQVLKDFGAILNKLFDSEFRPSARGAADETLQKIESAVRDAFRSILDDTSADKLRSGLGIDFDFEKDGQVLVTDTTRLTLAISREPEALADFLLSEVGHDGLIVAVEKALEEAGESLARSLDPVASRGLILNLMA